MKSTERHKATPIRYEPNEHELGVDSGGELRRIQLFVAIILVLLVLGFAALFVAMLVDQRTYEEPQPEGAPITTTNIATLDLTR